LTDLESGADLAKQRKAVGISQAAIAQAMGVTRQRVHLLEKQIAPQESSIDRYHEAILQVLTDRATLDAGGTA